MSSYLICQTKTAQKPYCLTEKGLNLYSLEEVCYYISKNIFDIEENFLNDDFLLWMEIELGEKLLANKLKTMESQGISFYLRINELLRRVNYLFPAEILHLKTTMERLAICDSVDKYKLKGDNCMAAGEYNMAYKNYLSAVTSYDIKDHTDISVSKIYYNMGLAKMYLFQFEEALNNFKKAYRYNSDNQNTDACLTAIYLLQFEKGDFVDEAVKHGFNISKVARVEEQIQNTFNKVDNVEAYSLKEAARITALSVK